MKDIANFLRDIRKLWEAMTPRARKIVLALAGGFILLLVFRSCAAGKRENPDPGLPTVLAMRVETGDLKVTLDYAGDIKARDEAMVYPKVGGKIIEKVREDGSPVVKGDTIAYVDRDEVGFKFEKAPVESPLTGVIGRTYVDIGTQVSPQTAIAMVVDMEEVEIQLNIPEKYLPKIKLGQTALVSVDSYPDVAYMGAVTRISPVVDITTRTALIEITIDNAEYHLKPGMFAKVKLVVGVEKNVPLVRKEAVLGRGDYAYVYVVEDGVVRKRKIRADMRQGEYYGLRGEVNEGDLVIIMGQQKLRDGSAVEVEIEKKKEDEIKEQTGEK
ncbi:MAG: efflux RND transporter periplasmic adaptor subunit [Candidatus Omnitrophica bacterium]|nr:efflux RND transporter periplasmic adaptor subunit [Candidatus Omnitrophota bacterium]MDD4013206.1 efflux RND transporter periplasmic adaptor subunit [Candidatus Omnitrophota bacterium]